MPDDFIAVSVTGDIKNIENFLQRYPLEAQNMIVDDINAYLVKVFQTYPPQNYVTRRAAYGQSFFTEKQRRWFFAALNRGEINVPYRRTQGIRNSWEIIGKGKNSIIANEAPGVEFVMGDKTQSRHEARVGWKTTGRIIQERMNKIVEVANGAARKVLRKLKVA